MTYQPRPLKFPSVLPMHGDLALKFLFNARSGNKVYDYSGHRNHGTITGANWIAGRASGGLNFDASSEYVLIPDASSLTTPTAFTWIAKFKLLKPLWGVGEEWATIMSKNYFDRELWFTIFADRTIHVRLNSAGYIGGSTGTVTWGVYQTVAVTWDGENVRYYINGDLDTTDPYVATIADTAYNLRIGDVVGDAYHFYGELYELQILKRTLSPAEIKRVCEHELLPVVL